MHISYNSNIKTFCIIIKWNIKHKINIRICIPHFIIILNFIIKISKTKWKILFLSFRLYNILFLYFLLKKLKTIFSHLYILSYNNWQFFLYIFFNIVFIIILILLYSLFINSFFSKTPIICIFLLQYMTKSFISLSLIYIYIYNIYIIFFIIYFTFNFI